MDENIKKLTVLMNEHQDKVKAYSDAIKALQLICDHAWIDKGHSHNDSLYRCDKCGLEKWE